MDDDTIILLEYLKLSVNRQKVIKAFDEDYLRPIQISKKVDIQINSVSNILRQLKDKGLVYVLNPDDSLGRLYRLTDKGKEMLKLLEENQ